LNICLTNKLFKRIIEDTAFWKLRLKQNKSWKQLCKLHANSENFLNSKDLYAFSFISLKQCILNSEVLKFLNGMIKTVAGMGYWGIYLHARHIKFRRWENGKKNTLRHFDFWRDNGSNKYFDELEIIITIRGFGCSDLNETLKYINKNGIYYKLDMCKQFQTIKLFISWEAKEEEEAKAKEQTSSCRLFQYKKNDIFVL